VLRSISDWLPLSHSIEALQKVTTDANGSGTVLREVGIIALWALAFVVVGSLTLRRRTE
jgi:ABC-2 type transport system permease protein